MGLEEALILETSQKAVAGTLIQYPGRSSTAE
jgi:hypothetical protein